MQEDVITLHHAYEMIVRSARFVPRAAVIHPSAERSAGAGFTILGAWQ